jgi:hypothetical protein
MDYIIENEGERVFHPFHLKITFRSINEAKKFHDIFLEGLQNISGTITQSFRDMNEHLAEEIEMRSVK